MGIIELKNRLRGTRLGDPVFRYMRDHRVRRAIRTFERRPLPECVIVELTNVCNLRCAKCPTYDVSRGRGMMAADVFAKLLADIAAADGPTTISLNGGGEAVLHPQIIDFVKQAEAVPNITHVALTTNALSLDPAMAKALLDAGLDSLKVSLDVTDAATYLKVNRVDGYDAVVRNLRMLDQIKSGGGYACDVTMKVTLYKRDLELVERIRVLWQEHVDHIKITGLHNWGGLRGKRGTQVRDTPCEYLWEQIQVLWNGQITLCCWDSMEGFYNLGNIAERDLADYWKNDPHLNAIRAAHVNKDFSQLALCASCNADTYFTQFYFHNPSQRRPGRADATRSAVLVGSDRS